MKDVYNFITNLDLNNKTVIAAISGGPDSMLLLNILMDLREKLNLNIIVAHVHHNIRKESDYEELKLREICNKEKLTFEFFKIEKYPNGEFSEEKARIIRYDFFDSLIKKYNTNILFTAHHGDDLIETILMRLTRGSSIKGYSGFDFISNDRGYSIIRPLMYLDKKEILNILDSKGVWYALDKTNENEEYKRNRYRLNILPVLKEENPNVHKKFIEYHNKLLKADEYIKNQVENIYFDIVEDGIINVSKFNELDSIVKEYLLEEYLSNVYKNNITLLNNNHTNVIINLLYDKNGITIDLPNNKIGILEYNKFKIIEKKENYDYDYKFTDNVDLPNGKRIYIDNNTKLTSNFVIHLDSKDIKLPFHVRNRQIGDYMTIKNMQGKKKISDIMTDSKVSKEIRDSYPIVTDDSGVIIWIPGIKKSNLDRKKSGKYDIILKYD